MVIGTGKGCQVINEVFTLWKQILKNLSLLWLIKQLGYITVCNKGIQIINMKDKELLFHLKVDICIESDDHKMFMKELWVEIWRFLIIHIVIFKDSLLKNINKDEEPKLFQDETSDKESIA